MGIRQIFILSFLVVLITSCAGSPVRVSKDPELSSVLPKEYAVNYLKEIQGQTSINKCQFFKEYFLSGSSSHSYNNLEYRFVPYGGEPHVLLYYGEGTAICPLKIVPPVIPKYTKTAIALESLGIEEW